MNFTLLLIAVLCLLTVAYGYKTDEEKFSEIYPNVVLWRQYSGPRLPGPGRVMLSGYGSGRYMYE